MFFSHTHKLWFADFLLHVFCCTMLAIEFSQILRKQPAQLRMCVYFFSRSFSIIHGMRGVSYFTYQTDQLKINKYAFHFLSRKGNAIKCYECNSHTDIRCAMDEPPEELSTTCVHPKTFCRKIVQQIDYSLKNSKN